jgi:diacylglycerol kinase (ATP)
VTSVVVLTNPAAGVGQADRSARLAVARLRDRGLDVLDVAGHDPDDALRIAREAAAQHVDTLVVVGGDGMIALAIQALTGTDVPLGIIPAGTGNDHARQYGLPRGDPAAAADVVADGHVTAVDVGRIAAADGTVRYFGSIMAAGFDSLVSDRTNRLRWPRGRMRYHLAILIELAQLSPLPFRLVLDGDAPDGGTVIEQDLMLAAIGNTRSYGGGMLICPDADPADGRFDLTLVRAMPRRRVLRFFPTVFTGGHVRRDEVQTHRATQVRIESDGINAYADGEYAGPLPVEVNVIPKALKVVLPG